MDGGHEGALAEFAALRQEIAGRSSAQQNILALQLTTSGALFGFALAKSGRAGLLLIVPVVSYLLLTRYLMRGSRRTACSAAVTAAPVRCPVV
jgi:hypothetical protein